MERRVQSRDLHEIEGNNDLNLYHSVLFGVKYLIELYVLIDINCIVGSRICVQDVFQNSNIWWFLPKTETYRRNAKETLRSYIEICLWTNILTV
jgi:hypothetical protein